MSKMFFLIAFICIVVFNGCHKPCQKNHYSFNGTCEFSPEKDSLRIGDTIWFNSVIPSKLIENNLARTIDYSGASNFATDIHFDVVSFENPLAGAIDSFVFIPLKGNIIANSLLPNAAKTIIYKEMNGDYEMSFGIVSQKKGIYCITVIDIENSKKNCSTAFINLTVNNSNRHNDYLNTIYFSGSPWGNSIMPITQSHSYCFKVY